MNIQDEIYDLVVIGGGASASLLSLSIFKLDPNFKVLIIETNSQFPRKIGESIVDLTAVFIKTLDIEHILEKHSVKTGVRFLFNETNSTDLADIAEFASPTMPGLVRGYHLNRSLFDQQMLDEVESKGAYLYRPAKIIDSKFEEFQNELTLELAGIIKKVKSKWVVDASGRSRYIANKLNWSDRTINPNRSAIMAHFKNVAPSSKWDTPRNDYWENCSIGSRAYSTTHLMRKNCWWWIIKLDEEITSLGMVYDNTKLSFDDYENYFLETISNDSQLSSLVKGAKMETIKEVKDVAYICENLHSKGIALLGDSGAFIDPLISPGLEMIGQQSIWLAELLTKDKANGKYDARGWAKYSTVFNKAYESRLRLYKNAYNFMESKDIFSVWLMQGNYFYFSTVVYPAIVFKRFLKWPMNFNVLESAVLKFFESRLNKIHNRRIEQNRTSKTAKNAIEYSGVRVPSNILLFMLMPIYLLSKSSLAYLKLEAEELSYRLKSNS